MRSSWGGWDTCSLDPFKIISPLFPINKFRCCRNVFAKVPVNSIPHINPGLGINDYISLLDQTRQRIRRQSRKKRTEKKKKNRQNRQTGQLPKINGCDFSLECSFTRLSSPVIKYDLLFEVRDSRLGRDICVVFCTGNFTVSTPLYPEINRS